MARSTSIYDALKEAKVSEDKARAAAAAIARVADVPTRTDRLGTDLDELKADVRVLQADVKDLEADVRLLKRMMGFNLAATMGVLWLLLRSMLR